MNRCLANNRHPNGTPSPHPSLTGVRGLLWPLVVTVFKVLEPSGCSVAADVLSQVFKLFGAPNEMIKALDLPKTPIGLQQLVDSEGREVLPGPAAPIELAFRGELRQDVNVVRHDDKVG